MRRVPLAARLRGEEPVPVVMAEAELELTPEMALPREPPLLRELLSELLRELFSEPVAVRFADACPQESQ